MIDPTDPNDSTPSDETKQATEATDLDEGAVSDADLDSAIGAGYGPPHY